eukprot:gb/GECH01008128.1/.p1 GENE.gb/GECH01008128.1/~~gb/GECH01008128.1/.p1  ORF type:complete len:152 (+),score=33.93 gb/GECH01008128.1/:1-456(+)
MSFPLRSYSIKPHSRFIRSENNKNNPQTFHPPKVNAKEGLASFIPEGERKRVARVFQPTQSTMSQGVHKTQEWAVDFETRKGWNDPLMGWASSEDTLKQTHLNFKSREAAIDFVERQGWGYYVEEPAERRLNTGKSYGDNFAYEPPPEDDW